MSGNIPNIYWDSCIFLHYLANAPQWMPILQPLLDNARDGKIRLYTSALTQVEVAFTAQEKLNRALDAKELAKIDALWHRKGMTMVDFNPFIAARARTILRDDMTNNRRQRGVNTADIIHLASALYVQADEMHTTEIALHSYTSILGFKITNPNVSMRMLPITAT